MENTALQQGLEVFYPLNTSFFFQSLVLAFFAFIIFKNFLKEFKMDDNLFVLISFISVAGILGFSSISNKFMHDSSFFIIKKVLLFGLTFVIGYLYFKLKKKNVEKDIKSSKKK